MHDFGIDLGASFTKVTCLRRVPGVDTYADPIFNSGVAKPIDVNAAYWYPTTRQAIARSFLVPSVVLWDQRDVSEVLVGHPAAERYRKIRADELAHRQAEPDERRRIAVFPFFNWKRRFLTEPDNPSTPQPEQGRNFTWADVASEYLIRLRESIAATQVPPESGIVRHKFDTWLGATDAHTRLCLPLTPHAKPNQHALESRMRSLLQNAGWPVADGRKVVSWEGTANLLGRITRGRNRFLPGGTRPDIDGIFSQYGFRLGRPTEGWTCMAIDVGHYTTDVAIYRYQKDGEEFTNPSAMDQAVFTCSEEVGVSSHLDVGLNDCLEQKGLARKDAMALLDFKQIWTAAAVKKEQPLNAARMVGVSDTDLRSFIASTTNAYASFADAVSRVVSVAIEQCKESWSHRVDATRFPNLHVDMIYLSGGVMEAPDLREMFRRQLQAIPSCARAKVDSPDSTKSADANMKWNTRLRSACAAGAVSVLGDSRV